jgi:phage antirepressor YoqD-like protein
MARIKKLTPGLLKKIVLEEKAKIEKVLEASKPKAKEVDADKLAATLEKKVDYAKALKIREARMRKELDKVVKYRKALAKNILGDL